MDTNIYRCYVTGNHYDPLALQRKLLVGSRGQVNSWIQAQAGNDELAAMEAEEKLIPLVRSAFQLQDVNLVTGTGHPTEFVLRVLQHYLEYAEAKKLKGQTSQPSLPCVDCP